MKVLLAGLALLPVIASHVFFQLPSDSLRSPNNRQLASPDTQSKDLQSSGDSSSSSSSSELLQRLRQNPLYPGFHEAVLSNQDLNHDLRVLSAIPEWSHLYASLSEPLMEAVKRSGGDYDMARIPESFPVSLQQALMPLLGYGRYAHNPSHVSRAASSSSSGQTANSFQIDGAKKVAAKRYLGIELPDYIASNYGADKSSSSKLHNLKQRMRSVGK